MLDAWDAVAQIRAEQIETGVDITFCDVFVPYYLKLLKEIAPSNLLEVGCGTGHLLKEMHLLGIPMHAIEPSSGMYTIACNLLKNYDVNIQKCKAEEFDPPHYFELVISHLCAQNVCKIENWLAAIFNFIEEKGMFCFSIPHPCFYNDYKKIFPKEQYFYVNNIDTVFDLKISNDDRLINGVVYRHRPLSDYIKLVLRAGFKIVDMDEIFPPNNVQSKYNHPWQNPYYLVFHLQK